MSNQLELHTESYHRQRNHLLGLLNTHTRGYTRFNQRVFSNQRLIRELMRDTKLSRELVRQTTFDPDAQL